MRTSEPHEYEHLRPLFRRMRQATPGTAEHQRLRTELVTGHRPIAEHVAWRFRGRGEAHDDLYQVAMLGLLNAIDRFEEDRDSEFLAFAVPTIMGEVRRYFRDSGWSMHVPRRLKELHSKINTAAAELSQLTTTAPTPKQIAVHLGLELDEVHEGIAAARAYRLDSLDQPSPPTRQPDMSTNDDVQFDEIEDEETLRPAIAQLSEQEQRVLMLRFYGDMTQTQIAQRLGVSQMQVSRLLSNATHTLRRILPA